MHCLLCLRLVFNSLSIEEKPGFPLWESRVSVILILFFLLFPVPASLPGRGTAPAIGATVLRTTSVAHDLVFCNIEGLRRFDQFQHCLCGVHAVLDLGVCHGRDLHIER